MISQRQKKMKKYQHDDKNNTHRDIKKRRERRKTISIRNSRRKDRARVSDMVYRTLRERENGGISRKKTRIYWAAPAPGLNI